MPRTIDPVRKLYLETLGLSPDKASRIPTRTLARLCLMDESSRKLVLTLRPDSNRRR